MNQTLDHDLTALRRRFVETPADDTTTLAWLADQLEALAMVRASLASEVIQ